MIPKIIHHIWLDESKMMPSTVVDCIKSIRRFNKDIEHKLWTHSDIDFLYSILNEDAKRGIDTLKKRIKNNQTKLNVFMSGIFRIAVANHFGGLYVDSDLLAFKKFPEQIFEKDLFLVIPNPGAQWVTDGIFGMNNSSKDISNTIFKNCKNNFTPAPQFFTKGIIQWASGGEVVEKINRESIIKNLNSDSIILDHDNNYFFTKKPSGKHDPVCVHVALASWHERGKSKIYKERILHEEQKLHISKIYEDTI